MGQDEAGTVRDLKGRQAVILPLVGRHGGRFIDTADDGILAEFPSVIGATECALEIQNVMAARNEEVAEHRQMLFRMGINLGDVIHDETRIYGDGINYSQHSEPSTREALALVDRAVELDPGYAQAHGLRAVCLAWRAIQGWEHRATAFAQAATSADHAVACDPGEPWAHLARGFIAVARMRDAETVDAFSRAIEASPNSPTRTVSLERPMPSVDGPTRPSSASTGAYA